MRRPVLVALCLCCGHGVRVQAAEPPSGVLRAGEARLAVLRDGRFSLTCGDAVLISGARLVVAGVGWKGMGDQANARILDGYPRIGAGRFVVRGEIAEPLSKTPWRFEERVEVAGKAFRFAYEAQPLADTKVAEVCLFLDLPLARWRGQRILLWPGSEGRFPEKQPRERHFLSGMARRAVLGVAADRQVTLDFARPAFCTVQDLREYRRELYQLYPRLFGGGPAKAGQKHRLEFTLIPRDRRSYAMTPADYGSKQPLKIGDLRLPASSVACYKRFEALLDVSGTYKTPFDPDEIRVDGHVRTPSGRQVVVPAFFTRDYELMRQDGDAWLEPRGKPGWRLRFAATEVGKHSLHVIAKDRSGEARSNAVGFEATPSDDPGYIRVSRKDKRYFEFDNGRPYFAVGENVCTWRRDVTDYDAWFPSLGKARGNFARIWMWAHCFGIEWGRPGQYRLDHAWKLDYALGLAERHGIYIKLCLEAWRGFGGPRSFVRSGVAHPYSARNGGPCQSEMDVFTDPEAKRMFRNRLRYLVARWGCSTHIMAWEFWNEINCVWGYHKRSQDVIAWTAEMGRHLKQIDPWRHLVVNSLGSFQVDNRLWKLPEVDFAQVHGYWHPSLPASKEMGKDMAAMVPHWLGRIAGYGKPALFAEFGLVNPRWGHSPRADDDRDGVHLHNGLWSSIMTGAAGTAMLWWWGNYVHPKDLYYHFAAVARFVDGVPWTTAGFRAAKATASMPRLRVLGLQGKGLALLWLQNRDHTWWNVVNKQPIRTIEEATVPVSGLDDGEHQVEWWDTWRGEVTRRETLQARQGALTLGVASLTRDVALKITRR